MSINRKILGGIAVAASLSLSGCADYTNTAALNNPDVNVDPYEGWNRAMYGVNNALDTVLIRPVTWGYRAVMPEYGRARVSDFVHNLGSPVYFANSVLQGDVENSFAVMWRFVLNTTVGIGGLFDVASEGGLKARDTDFGQTLAVWGVGSGPYTFVPVFGPGTTRDTVGRFVDLVWNPSIWAHDNWYSAAQAGITIVDKRSNNWKLLEDIQKTSLDPYATFRSGYMQYRASEIAKLKASYKKSPVFKDATKK